MVSFKKAMTVHTNYVQSCDETSFIDAIVRVASLLEYVNDYALLFFYSESKLIIVTDIEYQYIRALFVRWTEYLISTSYFGISYSEILSFPGIRTWIHIYPIKHGVQEKGCDSNNNYR